MALKDTIGRVAAELGFSSAHSLSKLLGLDKENKGFFRSLPFVDTIYYPCSHEEVEKDYFSSLAPVLEEDIHLYQFRRSSSGWFTEVLNRKFCNRIEEYKKKKSARKLSEARKAWTLLKDYADSIRAPLELEAHILLMVLLMQDHNHLIDVIHEPFLEMFSLGKLPEDPAKARGLIEQEFLQDWMATIKNYSLLEDEHLFFAAHWLKKTSEVLRKVARDFWKKGLLTENDYLDQVGNCLEFKTIPSVAALVPTEPPQRTFIGTTEDPRNRLEVAAKALLDLPEAAIRKGDMSGVMERIESVMPVMDKYQILSKRELAGKYIHAEHPMQPLITLRLASQALDTAMQQRWTPLSSICDELNDDSAPSILIFLEHDEPVIELHNPDLLGKRFLKELELLCDGYELLN